MSFKSPSAPWSLAPQVHAACVDADIVFLDVQADAYFCLPAGVGEVEGLEGGERLTIRDDRLAASLVDRGLLAPRRPGMPAARAGRPADARRSALNPALPPVRLGDAGPLIASTADLVLHYRGRPFAELLRAARASRRQAGARPPRQDLRDVVERFHRWVPYAPVSGKCLLRAFMLLRLLHRHGLDADWVIGVTTWPFRAHCWLQSGDLVLDDTLDRTAAFTPILIV
jgi:hypothetical protein